MSAPFLSEGLSDPEVSVREALLEAAVSAFIEGWKSPFYTKVPVSKRHLRRYLKTARPPKDPAPLTRKPHMSGPSYTVFGHREVLVVKDKKGFRWLVRAKAGGTEREICQVGWRYAFSPKELMVSDSAADFLMALDACLAQQPLAPEEQDAYLEECPTLKGRKMYVCSNKSAWRVPDWARPKTSKTPPEEPQKTPRRKGKLTRKRRVRFGEDA